MPASHLPPSSGCPVVVELPPDLQICRKLARLSAGVERREPCVRIFAHQLARLEALLRPADTALRAV